MLRCDARGLLLVQAHAQGAGRRRPARGSLR